MATWSQFVTAAPTLAAQVRALLEQYGRGMGYLATVRPDGGPRVHPVAPVLTDDGLFCFVLASPKRRDLERDGRYALHSLPAADSIAEAYLAGTVARVTDRRRVSQLAGQFRAAPGQDWRVFELHVDVVMVGSSGPGFEIWHAPAGAAPAGAAPADVAWPGTAQGHGRTCAGAAGQVK